MKKVTILAFLVLSFKSICFATWDVTTPAGSESKALGDDRIRELKTDIQTALQHEGDFPGSDTSNPHFIYTPSTGTSAQRPTGIHLSTGMLFINRSSGTIEQYTGSTWEPVAISSNHSYIHVKSFGALGNGVTDDTNAINAAISAAGYGGTVSFETPGVSTYMTTGNHVLNGRRLVGSGKNSTRLKKISGTSHLLITTGSTTISGMTLDGNSLTGSLIVSSGVISGATQGNFNTYRNIRFTNVASPDYALRFWEGNTQWTLCDDLEFRDNYGHMWLMGVYYTSFNRTKMYNNTGGYSILLSSTGATQALYGVTDVIFRDTYIEGARGVFMNGMSGIRDLTFDGLRVRMNSFTEPWWQSVFNGAGGETAQITIKNASFLQKVNTSTIPIFDMNSFQMFMENVHVYNSVGSSGWSVIRDRGTSNLRLQDFTVESTNPWLLFSADSQGGYFTTADSVNYTQGVVGTATWSCQVTPGGVGTSPYIRVSNSNLHHKIAATNGDSSDSTKRGGYFFENILGELDLTNTNGPVFVFNSSASITDPKNAVVDSIISSGTAVGTTNTGKPVGSSGSLFVVGSTCSVVLYPGTHELWGSAVLERNSATFNGVDFRLFIASQTTTGSVGGLRTNGKNYLYMIDVATNTFNAMSMSISPFIATVTSPTTYYLGASVGTYTSGVPLMYGEINSKRKSR